MLIKTFLLVLFFLSPAARVAAQASAAPAEALKSLEFLLGAWAAESDLPAGGKFTVERTCERIFSGKFLRITQSVRLPDSTKRAESWLGYDPGRQALTVWEFSSDGSYTLIDHVAATPDGAVLEGRSFGGAGAGPVRATLKRAGADRYTEMIERNRDGAWAAQATLNFVRRAAPSSEAASAASPADERLKPLELLAGNWRAEGESEGTKFAVDYAIQWTLGGNFLRSDYSVTTNGKAEFQGAAYFFLDAETKALRQLGFSADGGVTAMKAIAAPDSIKLDGETIKPSPVAEEPARPAPTRITYSRPDGSTLAITTEVQRQNGAWRRSATASFKRRP